MCGIVGVTGNRDASNWTWQMLKTISYRGPDGNGVINYPHGSLGMCRLRIRSPDAQSLPFVEESTGSYAAYNGEVYGQLRNTGNYSEAPTGGTKEVYQILSTYQNENTRFFSFANTEQKLTSSTTLNLPIDGMYALAQMFPNRNGVTLIRDRWGIKPLFYRELHPGYGFASELKPLLEISSPPKLREGAIAEFLAFGRPLGNHTFYDDIWSVPPGGSVHLKAEGMEEQVSPPWFDGTSAQVDSSILLSTVRSSLEKCLLSERQVGVALSGGLDSSILAFELNELGVENLVTISLCIPGVQDGVKSLSELNLPANGAWQTWQHRCVDFTLSDLPRSLIEAVNVMGQPTRMSSVPLYLKLAQTAQESGITVLLSGEGADEMFFGYSDYLVWQGDRDRSSKLDRLQSFALSPERQVWLKQLLGEESLEWCQARFRETYGHLAENCEFSALRNLELSLHLEPLLVRLDHCLMRYAIEGRTPYLHGKVPQVAKGMKIEQLLQNTQTKVALRNAWLGRLSPKQVERQKHPFRMPIETWFSRDPYMIETLISQAGILESIGFKLQGIEALRQKLEFRDRQVHNVGFSLLMLILWIKNRRFKNEVHH